MRAHGHRAARAVRHGRAVLVPVRAARPAVRPPEGPARVPPRRDAVPAVCAPDEPRVRVWPHDARVGAVQPHGRALRAGVWQAARVRAAHVCGHLPCGRRVRRVPAAVWTPARGVRAPVHAAVPCAGAVCGRRAV